MAKRLRASRFTRRQHKGNLNRIKDLIAAGEDVNKKYEGKLVRREFIVEVKERLQGYSGNYLYKGYSPLHLAAMNGHEPVIKYLIANGADLNATSTGGTPLHLAIRWERATVYLHWGTDVYGHKLRNNKTAKLLISEGADLNKTQGGGETILYKNITNISADFLEYLVANGADVNMKNAKGFTPLHRAVAASFPLPEKIEFLISHGAKINTRTKAGTTPLDWVVENKKISDLLRKHGGKTSEELKTQESE